MPLADLANLTISLLSAAAPQVQALNVPLIAAYHNHYPDRVRVYSTASGLSQMVTDGFSVNEPAYKAASAICSQPNTPAQFCIGRRAIAPQQTLQLTLTDGTIGDAYAFTLVGSDGVSHALTYTNVAQPGTPQTTLTGTASLTNNSATVTFSTAQTLNAGDLLEFTSQPGTFYTLSASITSQTTATLTGSYTGLTVSGVGIIRIAAITQTVSVTNGSASITFSASVTYSKGDLFVFSSQPGVYYALSANITASTAGTLTTAYSGTTAGAATTVHTSALNGTFNVTNGSSSVPTTTSQVGVVAVGDSLMFVSQMGVYYTVAAVTASTITLTNSYTGTTNTTANAADVCSASYAAAFLGAQIATFSNVGAVAVGTAVLTLSRTDGKLTDVQGWLSNGFGNVQLQDNTADPGIATDLAAIRAANNGAWYALILDSNSSAEIQAAAAWAEATGTGGKYLFWNNSDWGNWQTSVSNDVFSKLQTAAYVRDFGLQNNQQLLCYAGAALCSQVLAMNPGSYSLAYKTLSGVPADNDTTLPEAGAMALNSYTASNPTGKGKLGNYYKTVAGVNWTFPGITPSGEYADIALFVDWLFVNMQADVVGVMAGLPKLPFTDFGLGLLGDAIDFRLRLGASPTYGGIVPDGQDPNRPIKVTVPKASSFTPAQRQTRNASGFSWSAGLSGAILVANVTGSLIP